MPPRPDPAVGDAIKLACDMAKPKVTQKQIAAAADVDQTTVSAWINAKNWPPIWALRIIDQLCNKPGGHVLRLARYIEDGAVDALAAIEQDPNITDPIDRECLRHSYRLFSTRGDRVGETFLERVKAMSREQAEATFRKVWAARPKTIEEPRPRRRRDAS